MMAKIMFPKLMNLHGYRLENIILWTVGNWVTLGHKISHQLRIVENYVNTPDIIVKLSHIVSYDALYDSFETGP